MKSLWVKQNIGEKYVQEGFLGEESLDEKYMGDKYVQEELLGEECQLFVKLFATFRAQHTTGPRLPASDLSGHGWTSTARI